MTDSVLMKLGSYKFGLSTAAYQTLRRSRQYSWQAQNRLGARPGWQFTGEGETAIELSGVIYSELGGVGQIDAMEAEAATGEPLLLVAGTGELLGYWAVRSVQGTGSYLYRDGVPRKQEFSLSMVYYGDVYEGGRG